jgi:diguanylate cyclase (GGDEF)-like protein
MDDAKLESGDLLAILDITRRMAEQRLVAPLLQYVVYEALKLTGAERCYIVMFGPAGELNFRITLDQYGNAVEGAEDQVSHSVLRKVRETLAPLILRDALDDADFKQARSVRSLSLRSVMCVPLVSYGKAIGAIYVENRSVRGRFKEADLTPLVLFANQATIAVENAAHYEDLEARVAARTHELMEANARLEQRTLELQQRMAELEALRDQLQELSVRDSLTGLYNRRYLIEALAQLFEQAKRYGRGLSVAVADLDNFKHVNDAFSHEVGDHVLRAVARMMLESLRRSDIVARSGGEEFVLILPETPVENAVHYCERLRTTVERYGWQQFHPDLNVTISIGVADNRAVITYEEQLRVADRRLYIAKGRGKNQTVSDS